MFVTVLAVNQAALYTHHQYIGGIIQWLVLQLVLHGVSTHRRVVVPSPAASRESYRPDGILHDPPSILGHCPSSKDVQWALLTTY